LRWVSLKNAGEPGLAGISNMGICGRGTRERGGWCQTQPKRQPELEKTSGNPAASRQRQSWRCIQEWPMAPMVTRRQCLENWTWGRRRKANRRLYARKEAATQPRPGRAKNREHVRRRKSSPTRVFAKEPFCKQFVPHTPSLSSPDSRALGSASFAPFRQHSNDSLPVCQHRNAVNLSRHHKKSLDGYVPLTAIFRRW